MIDKLEVRVHRGEPFHLEFAKLYADIASDPKGPLRRSAYYASSVDLRPYGYDAILHLGCTRTKQGHHKVELLDTENRTLAGMIWDIEGIFQVDATNLTVTRIDLAADVTGVHVSQFRDRVRVKHKRWAASIGIERSAMGTGGDQTLYFGKRPNLVRIYDKRAELAAQYAEFKRKSNLDADLPNFEQLYRLPLLGPPITRVERQFGGGRVPRPLRIVGRLRDCADFNPFENLELAAIGLAEPDPAQYSYMEYGAGMYLRQTVQERGLHRTRQHISQHWRGNAGWVFRRFADFLPAKGDGLLTSNELHRLYGESTLRQAGAGSKAQLLTHGVYLAPTNGETTEIAR